MADRSRLRPLASTAFVGALALLVLNDWVLKAQFHNGLTGKLSDFAGLFALAFFCGALWPRHGRWLAAALAAAFVFWKSAYSQVLIDWLNGWFPVPVGRTVDASDLLALPCLWLGFFAVRRVLPWERARGLRWVLAIASPLAFTATSYLPHVTRGVVDLGPEVVGSAGNAEELALTRIVDEIAANYDLDCTLCDPLDQGRIYEARSGNSALMVSFDPADARVHYDVRSRSPSKRVSAAVDRLSADLRAALRERFPGMEMVEFASGRDAFDGSMPFESLELTVTIPGETPGGGADESTARRFEEIVEAVALANGFGRDSVDPRLFYVGRLVGPSRFERELVLRSVQILRAPPQVPNAVSVVLLERRADRYAELQDVVAAELEARLGAEFGGENLRRVR